MDTKVTHTQSRPQKVDVLVWGQSNNHTKANAHGNTKGVWEGCFEL